jgi:hypothetical protein
MNDRLYAAVFWPAAMPDTPTHGVLRMLERRWKRLHETDGAFRMFPQWPYLDLGEAHQWLLLGQVDRAWQTMAWFWEHQASPGLYSWWEGRGEPFHEWKDASHRWRATFHQWRPVRGWFNPPSVTPQYWSAAEMLLLQLDMLGYADTASDPISIVVGAGIPKQWLDRPLRVRALAVPGGLLDWDWDGHQVSAVLRDGGRTAPRLRLRLGPAFPPGTPLQIERRGGASFESSDEELTALALLSR